MTAWATFTAGIEAENWPTVRCGHDDYNIMMKALADRLAEAFAERMHEIVRKDLWLRLTRLSTTKRSSKKSIRVSAAPTMPTSEKATLFRLLDGEAIPVSLTENFAMTPAASVGGRYFLKSPVLWPGKIDKDQVTDIAARRIWIWSRWSWLAPNLSYDR